MVAYLPSMPEALGTNTHFTNWIFWYAQDPSALEMEEGGPDPQSPGNPVLPGILQDQGKGFDARNLRPI